MRELIKKMSIICITSVIAISISSDVNVIKADSKYVEVIVQIPSGKENEAATYIQNGLNQANLNPGKHHKIIIKPTVNTQLVEYNLYSQLKIYDNTWLYVSKNAPSQKVVFNKRHTLDAMVVAHNIDKVSYGYEGFKNIKIEGGIWNGKTSYISGTYLNNATFDNFRFGHGRNLEFKNLTLLNNNNSHHAHLAGINGLTITGCTFEGYKIVTTSYKEAVQLDILANTKIFQKGYAYDHTPFQNVKVTNNIFRNVHRGIGTHSISYGVYHTNVTISNNTFENVDNYAIMLMNYKNTTVSNNKMKNVVGGIDFRYAKPKFDQFYIPSFKTKANSTTRSSIVNNTIDLRKGDKTTIGIRTYGVRKIKDNKKTMLNAGAPYDNYGVKGIKIENNTITNAENVGIGLDGTVDSYIRNNRIYYNDDKKVPANKADGKGIYLKNSLKNTVSNNEINNNKECTNLKYGIYLYKGSTGNKLIKCKVYNAMWYGIALNNKSSATIKENKIEKTKKSGIYITGKSDASIEKNTVNITETGYGIYINKGNKISTISNNKIKKSKKTAIYINKTKVGKIYKNKGKVKRK